MPLELYLFIVVSLIVSVFPAYFTHVHVLYIVAFGPSGIQVAIPNMVSEPRVSSSSPRFRNLL
jgi:uncharacterized membrane protein